MWSTSDATSNSEEEDNEVEDTLDVEDNPNGEHDNWGWAFENVTTLSPEPLFIVARIYLN